MSDTTAPSAAETTDATPTATEQPQVTPADLAPAAQETAPDTGQEPQTTDTTDQLPDWAREKLAKANSEAAKYRTRAKDTEQAKAAEFEAYKQERGKTLGLIEDDQPAPDDLIAAAEKRATEAAQQLATYQRRDAIRTAAASKVTDTDILTALLNQDAEFTALDPSAADYAEQVSAAVDRHITDHPTLRAQAAPQASGVDTSTTNTGSDRKISLQDLDTMSPQEIYEAGKAGKLNHLYK
ncbi:hypothetical protein [Corynebacterium variabile]|uniref:hypothetical protein n=1 Tax=Corynebacterium variabile TaxID=1727 RepID=UPI002647E43E|nr:hypothetical protein [Corynebacterium variabile]MDN6676156.1 hypothetical protein [Corynebacterium variabile]